MPSIIQSTPYPSDYRSDEVSAIMTAVRAGECVSVVGLSGAGKSNLLRFLAEAQPLAECQFVLIDCNRLPEPSLAALFQLIRRALGQETRSEPPTLERVEAALEGRLNEGKGSTPAICLMFDRFDDFAVDSALGQVAANNLRALRDTFKYRLTLLVATRRPLPARTEFAELFHGRTLWLGPMSMSDAQWEVARYATRSGLAWGVQEADLLIQTSGAYPSFLRAACEALASGAAPDTFAAHPAVQARLEEFWSDAPSEEDLRRSRLAGNALLSAGRQAVFDTARLTAKENALLAYFQAHEGKVCEKDELIRAVWPEDQVFEKGVRDDSLAQLVRRLREKIEVDPASPQHIHTAPGRGYIFRLK